MRSSMSTKLKITIKQNRSVPLSFFSLKWQNDVPLAEWSTTKPENTAFEANVNWRCEGAPSRHIILCCTEPIIPNQLPKETMHHNDALFKSLLQKCVRRQMPQMALQTAWHLLKMDANAFLRRLFVIMLEDVCLHSSVSVIIWLTSAITKGYQLQTKHINWLLGLVQYLCQESHKSYINFVDYSEMNPNLLLEQTDRANISLDIKGIIYSTLFRHSYGGMRSDLHMFYWYAQESLHESIPIQSVPIVSIDANIIQPLKVDEILLNSADFHCFPQILKMLHQHFPQYSEQIIKNVIWECNSKTNTRRLDDVIDPTLLTIWKEIEPVTRQVQKQLIG